MTELSDELLVAYVDGQLAHDQSLAIERVLKNDDVAARRVEVLRAAHSRLEVAFEAMLANELNTLVGVADSLEPEPAPEPKQRMWLLRQAGPVAAVGLAMAMLTAGAVGGYALRDVPEPASLLPAEKVPVVKGAIAARDWQDDLVIAHNLFSRESLSVGLDSQGNVDLLGFHLGNIIGTEVLIPDLGPFGLTFKRAQLLEREGIPIVQLAYLPLEGEPIALYVQWNRGSAEQVTFTQSDNVSAAQWRQNNLTYLLAGTMSLAQMEELAANVRTQIAERNVLSSTLPEPQSAAAARAGVTDPAPPARPDAARAPAETRPPAEDAEE
jgi:anti-sigma factor RsiW